LGGETFYATNTSFNPYYGLIEDDFTCHGSTFTQYEASGPNPGTSSGTFTYASYSPTVALLTLKYTSPSSQVGATNYLEATFLYNTKTNGFLNGIYYSPSGDPSATGYGQFYLH
jgi:hypothetical protein